MRYAIADERITDKIKSSLLRFCDKVILLPPYKRLAKPVASHPDMLLCLCYGKLVTYREYFEEHRDIFSELSGIETVLEEREPREEYPHDISLNCAAVGEGLIAHGEHISPALLGVANEHGMSLVPTKQGYAKCSTVVVSDTAIITADASVERSAIGAGLDVLRVRAGYVDLEGYDTGFLGGASGTTETAVLFCGSLDSHPDAAAIRAFCQKHGKEAVSLSDEPLYDYGTVIFVGKS